MAIRGEASEGAEVEIALHSGSRGAERARESAKRITFRPDVKEFKDPRRFDPSFLEDPDLRRHG